MKIGQLNLPSSGVSRTVETTRTGGRAPYPADGGSSGTYRWNWQNTMLTGVEFRITFEKEVFAAMIRLDLTSGALYRAEVLAVREDGEQCVGAHAAEEGGTFGGTVTITTASRAQTFVVRLIPAMVNLELPEPAVIGAAFDEPVLYPTPCRVEWKEGRLPLAALACAAADAHPDSGFALGYFRERMAEQWAIHAVDGESAVRFSHAEDLPKEGYRLTVTPDGITAEAGDRLGILYAAERILELSTADGVPACVIDDAPFQPMRGFHFGLPAREQIPFMKELLRRILIPFHYNHLIMEFAGGMRFDSHPEISEAWLEGNRLSAAGEIPTFPHGSMNAGGKLLEKEEVRDFCDYARSLGLELIPEVQSLGHVQYITYAHPDIAETDESVTERRMDTRDTDQPPSTYYHHSYCPQNPKSYAIIFDLIDEIVDVVRPTRFVHMGHDEIYQMGLCPKCRKVPHDQLYEMHISALHAHLAKKGLRMMIWSDMLQPVTKYKCFPALTRLPKDIVYLDFIWYFHFGRDIEENLLPYGNDIMIGNLYSSHFPRYESRIRREHMIGGQVSTWCPMTEYMLAKKGKLYDLMYTAEMLWSDTYTEQAREVYAAILAERLPVIRARMHGDFGPAKEFAPLSLPAAAGQVPGKIRALCPQAVRLLAPVTVPVNGRASALQFTHTTLWEERRAAWEPLTKIGTYTVRYADGTDETVDLEYDGNIRRYTHRWASPKPEQYYRHQGYAATWLADPAIRAADEDGGTVTILSCTWTNPHPEKEIREIVCEEYDTSSAGVVLCGVGMAE